MLPPLPRCSGRAYSSLKNHPSVSAFPDSTIGSACTSSFSRFARRSLALRPAHSRSHLGDRYPRASDISSPPCLPRLLPAGANRRVGLAPTGKAPPCHGARGELTFGPTLRSDRRAIANSLRPEIYSRIRDIIPYSRRCSTAEVAKTRSRGWHSLSTRPRHKSKITNRGDITPRSGLPGTAPPTA